MSGIENTGALYDEKVSEPTVYQNGDNAEGEVHENVDFLHRRLGNRQIQLIAIGGSIGTVCCVNSLPPVAVANIDRLCSLVSTLVCTRAVRAPCSSHTRCTAAFLLLSTIA